MRAVVHIGMPNAGTTSLQKWQNETSAELLQRGVACERMPFPGKRRRRAHVELGVCQMHSAGEVMPQHEGTRGFYELKNLGLPADYVAMVPNAESALGRRSDMGAGKPGSDGREKTSAGGA